MTIYDIGNNRIESYIRYGIKRTFDSHDISVIGIKDIEWTRTNASGDDINGSISDEDDEPHIYIQATTICLLFDKDCTIDIMREVYVFSEEAFESSCANYNALEPDIDWHEDFSIKSYRLSDELPIGLDFMIIRYLKDSHEHLLNFLFNQEKPERFIKKINSKLLRNAVDKLWVEAEA